jgi:hypothetical protein
LALEDPYPQKVFSMQKGSPKELNIDGELLRLLFHQILLTADGIW